MNRFYFRIYIVIFIFFAFAQTISGQYKEYDVKAQYIHLFTNYIEWPENSMVNNNEVPFRICVIGDSPFGDTFTDLSKVVKIKGKTVDYHEVTINSFRNCDILFISKSEKNNLQKILKRAKGLGILLISDSNGFAEDGVMINFFLENEKVHFEINREAAEMEGVKISSRLLKLARIIK